RAAEVLSDCGARTTEVIDEVSQAAIPEGSAAGGCEGSGHFVVREANRTVVVEWNFITDPDVSDIFADFQEVLAMRPADRVLELIGVMEAALRDAPGDAVAGHARNADCGLVVEGVGGCACRQAEGETDAPIGKTDFVDKCGSEDVRFNQSGV